jgi:hypothetical protein
MSLALKDVFISYSAQDQATKDFLTQAFDNQGITYFLAENDLILGEDIEFSLKANLKNTSFTVLLVSKNSLFSTWVCLESIHRLQEESFSQKTTFLPVLVDLSVMSLDFPLEMARHYKKQLTELEAKRAEAKDLGISTKLYNDEIERIEKVLPQISEIIQKFKNGLSANFTDESRKKIDLAKLIQIIQAQKTENPPINLPNQNLKPAQSTILQEVAFFNADLPESDKKQLFAQAAQNAKFTPTLIDFEEKEIAYEFGDYVCSEIKIAVDFQFLGGGGEMEIGFELSQGNNTFFLYVWNPNYFQVGYTWQKKNQIFNADDSGGCEESQVFALAGNALVNIQTQIIAESSKLLTINQLATFKYYVNEQLIFTQKSVPLHFLPDEIYIYKKPVKNVKILGLKVLV